MRSFALVSLFVSLVGACGGSPPGGGSGTDSESGTSGSTGSTSSPTTTTNTTTNTCTPGQSIQCTCNDGQTGAQVCNAGGTFDPCECTGGTSDTTTTTTTTTSSTTDMSTSTTDLTASSGSSGGSTSGSTGGSSSGGSSSGGVGQSYGPCPGGDDAECQPGETCITGMSMMGMWSICTEGTCFGNGDCSTDLCTDAPGDGMFQFYCLLQTCNMQNPCPMGMTCFPGFGMGTPAVCLWAQ